MKRGDTLELEAPEVTAVMEAAGLKGGGGSSRARGRRARGSRASTRKAARRGTGGGQGRVPANRTG